MIFSYFKHYIIFLNVNEYLTVQFVELERGRSRTGDLRFLCLYRITLVWAFLQWHKFNLTYCLKSSLLLTFFFLLVCIVDQTQLHPSSISILGLFQGIICDIHSANPLFIEVLGFLKNHRCGDQDFLVKMREGEGGVCVAHIEKELNISNVWTL